MLVEVEIDGLEYLRMPAKSDALVRVCSAARRRGSRMHSNVIQVNVGRIDNFVQLATRFIYAIWNTLLIPNAYGTRSSTRTRGA
jgi:hypothetical protein